MNSGSFRSSLHACDEVGTSADVLRSGHYTLQTTAHTTTAAMPAVQVTAGGKGGSVPPVAPGGPKNQQQNLAKENERIEWVSAYAATVHEGEYKAVDSKKFKGGKVCVHSLTSGCQTTNCPFWHPAKEKGICIDFQKDTGCAHKPCKYEHILIGKPATIAYMQYYASIQKARNDKRKGESKGKGAKGAKGKTDKGAGEAKGKATGKGNAKNNRGEPLPPSDRPCSNFHSASSPGFCKHAANCVFRHSAENPTRSL